MVSALLMFHRLARTLRYAGREEDFLRVLSAAALLVAIGTVTYALGQGWNVVDSFYFAVATLTTSSIADPDGAGRRLAATLPGHVSNFRSTGAAYSQPTRLKLW